MVFLFDIADKIWKYAYSSCFMANVIVVFPWNAPPSFKLHLHLQKVLQICPLALCATLITTNWPDHHRKCSKYQRLQPCWEFTYSDWTICQSMHFTVNRIVPDGTVLVNYQCLSLSVSSYEHLQDIFEHPHIFIYRVLHAWSDYNA